MCEHVCTCVCVEARVDTSCCYSLPYFLRKCHSPNLTSLIGTDRLLKTSKDLLTSSVVRLKMCAALPGFLCGCQGHELHPILALMRQVLYCYLSQGMMFATSGPQNSFFNLFVPKQSSPCLLKTSERKPSSTVLLTSQGNLSTSCLARLCNSIVFSLLLHILLLSPLLTPLLI